MMVSISLVAKIQPVSFAHASNDERHEMSLPTDHWKEALV